VIYVTERGGRCPGYRFSDRQKSGADNVFRSDWTRSPSVRRFPSVVFCGPGHRNTNILYTLIKRLLGFCTITPSPPPPLPPPPPPHIIRIYNFQCREPSDRNSFIVFGTRRVHLKRQFHGGQLFHTEFERTPIDRPT